MVTATDTSTEIDPLSTSSSEESSESEQQPPRIARVDVSKAGDLPGEFAKIDPAKLSDEELKTYEEAMALLGSVGRFAHA
jgi:hypothetical protein